MPQRGSVGPGSAAQREGRCTASGTRLAPLSAMAMEPDRPRAIIPAIVQARAASVSAKEPPAMKTITTLLAAAAMLTLAANSAEAKGCIKGAVVGGVAGHYAGHHAVLGAIAGCAVGHHIAKQEQQQAREQAAHQEGQHASEAGANH